MSGFSFNIAATFSFQKCLLYMQRSPLESTYRIVDEQIIRLLSFPSFENQYLVVVSSKDDESIDVTVLNHTVVSREEKAAIQQYIVDWFDLERDLSSFELLLNQDLFLRDTISHLLGLRLIGVPDLFEALCWAIAGQQVNLSFAYRLKAQLVERYGQCFVWEGQSYYQFPAASDMLHVKAEDLMQLQFTRAKAETIVRVITAMNEGALSRQQLLDLSHFDIAEQQLRRIKGIGPWTANYVRMRCLRDASAYLPTDVGLQKVLAHWMQLPHKPTVKEVENIFANWRDHSSYVTFYLWCTLYHA